MHVTQGGDWLPLDLSPASRPVINQNREDRLGTGARGPSSHRQPPNVLQSDVLQTVVTSSRDAVGLLFRAAEQNDSDSSDEHTARDDLARENVLGSVCSMPSPALASNETLSLWQQHRFVRQGWFTSLEAVSYIEL